MLHLYSFAPSRSLGVEVGVKDVADLVPLKGLLEPAHPATVLLRTLKVRINDRHIINARSIRSLYAVDVLVPVGEYCDTASFQLSPFDLTICFLVHRSE